MTKKEKGMLWAYEHARHSSIYDAYKTPSPKKRAAYHAIISECEALNGYGARITGASSRFFSMAYKYDAADGTHLVYHTCANKYDFTCDVII